MPLTEASRLSAAVRAALAAVKRIDTLSGHEAAAVALEHALAAQAAHWSTHESR